ASFFFFSSRRRHTRLVSDWSSDVCSSDLRAGVWPGKARFIVWRSREQTLDLRVVETPEPQWKRFGLLGSGAFQLHQSMARLLWRSEERRVGKERRCRWAAYREIKKSRWTR